MSKFVKSLQKFDEFITDILTKFCWWTDIYLDKTNVWWVKVTLIVFLPFFGGLLRLIFYKCSLVDFLFLFLLESGIFWLALFLLLKYFSEVRKIFINATKNPNKNRIDPTIIILKIFVIPLMCIFMEYVDPTGFISEQIPKETLYEFFFFELCIYFLCTEPVPPGHKRDVLDRRKIRKFQTVPVSNK